MKNLVIVLLLLTTIVFGGYFLSQRQKASQAEEKVANLEAQLNLNPAVETGAA